MRKLLVATWGWSQIMRRKMTNNYELYMRKHSVSNTYGLVIACFLAWFITGLSSNAVMC